ncbi:MAG: hypothetical protein JXJ22_02835 [Bacteroidales bacterium]|nr:hypothetical protein [Bacteroidales bacterium]
MKQEQIDITKKSKMDYNFLKREKTWGAKVCADGRFCKVRREREFLRANKSK